MAVFRYATWSGNESFVFFCFALRFRHIHTMSTMLFPWVELESLSRLAVHMSWSLWTYSSGHLKVTLKDPSWRASSNTTPRSSKTVFTFPRRIGPLGGNVYLCQWSRHICPNTGFWLPWQIYRKRIALIWSDRTQNMEIWRYMVSWWYLWC